jgi:hypothetical protein
MIEAARRAAARPAVNRALEVERDQLRHEIDDYKFAIYYGDTQKDRECDERLAAARETQVRHMNELK